MTDLQERDSTPGSPPPGRRRTERPARPGRIRSASTAVARAVVGFVRSPVLLVGVALVAAATGFRAWTMSQTWFWLDDLSLVNIADRSSLSPADLATPYIGHLMPAGRALAWVVAKSGMYNYGVATTEILVLFAIAGLAVLRLLVTLFGKRPAILLLLTYFLFSPWLVPATSWWSVGINHLPTLAASALALDAHVRYLRTPERRLLVASVVWVFVGLLFAELTLLVYIPLTVITAAYFASGSLIDRAKHVWARYRWSVVTHAVLVLAYAALYLATRETTLTSTDKVALRPYITNFVMQTFPVAGIGGPGRWHEVWAAQFEARPTTATQFVALGVAAAIFTITAMTRERGLRAWLIPLLQLAACFALMVNSRSLFGAGLALDLRFTTPLALGVALALGLAFLPVVGAVESSSPRSARRSWLVDRWPVPFVALCGFVAFAVVTATQFPLLHVPRDKSPEAFYDEFGRSIAAHQTPLDLLPSVINPDVIPGPEAAYERAFVHWKDQLRYPEVVQDDYYIVAENGALVHPTLHVARRMKPPRKQSPTCDGTRIASPGGEVALDGPVFGFLWRVRLAYTASHDTPVTITTGQSGVDTELMAGTHVLEAPAGGQYDAIQLTGLDPNTKVCVTAADIGTTIIPGRPVH